MKDYKLYIVGGYVRDKLLGVKSKDIDFAFEFSEEFFQENKNESAEWYFDEMNDILRREGYTIHTTHPECFTTRGKFPSNHINTGLDADFVMCRKETYPDSTTRKPLVEIGDLYDDLLRRDFTLNAMAIDEDGVLIDPFGGAKDLENKLLNCPVDAYTSFMDDPLRMIRALRFCVTKGFTMSYDVVHCLKSEEIWEKFDKVVSQERLSQELAKMFKFDTYQTLGILNLIKAKFLKNYIFKNGMWLEPTTKKIKRK